jgi:hypothetical protein
MELYIKMLDGLSPKWKDFDGFPENLKSKL